jgi:hypothetical protein
MQSSAAAIAICYPFPPRRGATPPVQRHGGALLQDKALDSASPAPPPLFRPLPPATDPDPTQPPSSRRSGPPPTPPPRLLLGPRTLPRAPPPAPRGSRRATVRLSRARDSCTDSKNFRENFHARPSGMRPLPGGEEELGLLSLAEVRDESVNSLLDGRLRRAEKLSGGGGGGGDGDDDAVC